jgi:serine/threonine-protein kinase
VSDPLALLTAALEGRYRLEREIGQGGMATVWLARDLRHDRDVAVKLVRPEFAVSLGGERFMREIRLTARLQHPHILALHDSCQDTSCLYYIMPFVDGESLRARLEREQRLPIDDALRIASEVAGALAFAHAQGVVHRDLKPENILLQSGHALVADFGIALALDRAGATRVTATGFAVGTPAYMSPEQAFADPALDGRSDVYSLGVVLFELITGRLPRASASAAAFLAQFALPAATASALRPEVPPALDALLHRLLATDAADRPDAARLASELDGIRRGTGGSASYAPTVVLPVEEPVARDGVAVLEFRNLGRDASVDWLAAGIAETLTVDLRRGRRVRVVPQERVRLAQRAVGTEGEQSALEVARRCGARFVVGGSYQVAGGRLRIAATVADRQSPDEPLDLKVDGAIDEVFELQDRVLHGVLDALGAPGPIATPPAAAAPAPPRLDVYERYARARQAMAPFTPAAMQEAIALFQEAIALDERFAPAHAALGSCIMFRHIASGDPADLVQALGHLERAAALDPDLPEVPVRLTYLYGRLNRFAEARIAADRAIAAEPDNDEAWYFRGVMRLIAPGSGDPRQQWDEGIADLVRTLELSPDAQAAAMVAGWACRLRGDLAAADAFLGHAAAIEQRAQTGFVLTRWVGAGALRALVRLDQGDAARARALALEEAGTLSAREHMYRDSFLAQAHLAAGEAALRTGDSAAALESFGAARAIAQEHPRKGGMGWVEVRAHAGRARALAEVRLRRDAQEALAAAVHCAEHRVPAAGFVFAFSAYAPDALYDVAATHARLGTPEEALAWLRRAHEAGWANLPGLRADPSFAALLAAPGAEARLDEFRADSPLTGELRARFARVAERFAPHDT